MTTRHAVRRPPSPLAHGPAGWCDTCADCPSCHGGTRAIPTQYRPQLQPDGRLTAHCTACAGTGTVCHNLVHDDQEPTP